MAKSRIFIVAVLGILMVSFLINMFGVTGQVTSTPIFSSILYDDFSGGALNILKWEELPGSNVNAVFLDEHFVNPSEGAYHTAHFNPLDAGVRLNLIGYTFLPGDVLDYDVSYVSGSGNNIHAPDVNKNNGIQVALFGVWNNENFCAGNAFGKYHVKIRFTTQGTTTAITKPDGNTVSCQHFDNLIAPAQQYIFAFITRTGDNGIVHMDYDNVYITTKRKFPPATSVPTNPLPPSILGYWKFDEGNGNIAHDASLYQNDGVLSNGTLWTTQSISGYAIEFDGVDDYVNVLDSASLDLSNAFTIDAWIKLNGQERYPIIGKWNDNNGNYQWAYLMEFNNNVLRLTISDNNSQWDYLFGNTILQIGLWYHVTATFDNGVMKLYINDQLDAEKLSSIVTSVGQNDEPVNIGYANMNGNKNLYFAGIIDEVKIFDKAITPPPSLPLLGYWKFDEGSGNTVFDETTNHNDGLIQGSTWTTDSVSGYALEFDGIDDSIYIGQPPSLNLYNKVKIEAWIKRNSNQDGIVVSKNGPYYLRIAGNKIEGGVYFGGSNWVNLFGVTNIPLNQWYKVSMSYDGSMLNLYINDILDASMPLTGSMPYTGQSLYIGWGLPGQNQYFHGIMDEVKISGN